MLTGEPMRQRTAHGSCLQNMTSTSVLLRVSELSDDATLTG